MKKYKLGRKMLYFNSLLMVCVTIILFSIIIFNYINKEEQEFNDNVNKSANSLISNLDQMIFITDNTATQIAFNPYVKDIFVDMYFDERNGNYFNDEPSKKSIILKHVLPYLVNKNSISRIFLYNNKGDFFATGASTDHDDCLSYIYGDNFIKIQDIIKKRGNKKMVVNYSKDILSQDNKSIMSEGYLSVIQPIIHFGAIKNTLLGYVEVQLPISVIRKNLKIESNYEYASFYLGNNKIFDIGNSIDTNQYLLEKNAKFYDINMRMGAINRGRKEFISITLGLALLILIISIIGIYLIQRTIIYRVTLPLINFCKKIKFNKGEKPQKIDHIEEFAELEELKTSFNYMIQNLNDTVEELVLARTDTLEAQMKALQAQVDPHFIHNTLAIISALAEDDQAEKASEVASELSAMIRYTSDYSQSESNLGQEIGHAKRYLELNKVRYEEDFHYNIIVDDPEIYNVKVPKFILQPLIENSIRHSLKLSDFPWKIQIKSYFIHDGWRIVVSDNGYGIKNDKADLLIQKVERMYHTSVEDLLKEIKIGGYSLINTMLRLYISNSEGVYFNITSNEWGGTTVIIGGKRCV